MSHSFFKKGKVSPEDKQKIEIVLSLLQKARSLAQQKAATYQEILEILNTSLKTLSDLSFDTPHVTKEDLLQDLHHLKTMAEKENRAPMVSYINSVERLLRALLH